jgi:hypothetical protein
VHSVDDQRSIAGEDKGSFEIFTILLFNRVFDNIRDRGWDRSLRQCCDHIGLSVSSGNEDWAPLIRRPRSQKLARRVWLAVEI